MKKKFAIFLLFACVAVSSWTQEILTASQFFQSVSEFYGTIRDFESSMNITIGKNKMTSHLSFKRPNLLRIDFTQPDTQVIVFNGELLTIYLPEVRAILNQTVTPGSANSGAGLATPQGLSMMSRYYSVAYEVGQAPIPLAENSPEMVVKLILSRKNISEGFRTIRLSINPDTKLIRRLEATSINNELFIFDFSNYALNQNIPDTRFIYDAPSSANNYNNFLYTE